MVYMYAINQPYGIYLNKKMTDLQAQEIAELYKEKSELLKDLSDIDYKDTSDITIVRNYKNSAYGGFRLSINHKKEFEDRLKDFCKSQVKFYISQIDLKLANYSCS